MMLKDSQTAIGYVRVSTEEQATEGVSLEAQRAKVVAYCALHGHDLAQTYADEMFSVVSSSFSVFSATRFPPQLTGVVVKSPPAFWRRLRLRAGDR